MYKANINKSGGRNRQQYTNNREFQYPTFDNRLSRQKINKEILDLDNMFNQMCLTDFYRTFQPTAAEYKFFSSAHGTFSRIGNMLGHKEVLINLRY